MQVRAYNYWASLLGERNYPSVEDIEPDGLPDFLGGRAAPEGCLRLHT